MTEYYKYLENEETGQFDSLPVRKPMPGDVVRLTGKYWGGEIGALAVLDGFIGEQRDEFMAVFRASSFRGEDCLEHGRRGVVTSSGGPCPFIKACDLVDSHENIDRDFWKWKDVPRAGGGEHYTLSVPLWFWEGRE